MPARTTAAIPTAKNPPVVSTRSAAYVVVVLLSATAGCGDDSEGATRPEPSETPSSSASSAGPAGDDHLVQVGDRQLHLECQGEGSPVVILEPGDGVTGTGDDFAALRTSLAEQTEVCVYQRAGLGDSDPAPTPRTSGNVVEDLHGLLGAAGVAPPYVLAGVSAGGSFALQFAREHPDEVAGVLAMNEVPPAGPWQQRAYPLMTPDQITDEESYYGGDNEESIDWTASSDESDALPAPEGVPMVLLHSTVAQCSDEPDDGPCHRTADLYLDLGREYVDAWPGARFKAVDAGHDLQLADPDEVEQILVSLVDAAG